MNSERVNEIYTQIVLWFADYSPKDWRKSHINIEMLLDQGELGTSWQISSFVGDEEIDQEIDEGAAVELPLIAYFEELFDIANKAGEAWTICDFFVYNTGKYEVNYSYDEPPRLSGKDILSGSH